MQSKVTVVTPSRTSKLLNRLLESLFRTNKCFDGDIVVVDDGLETFPFSEEGVRFVAGVKPFCFARNVNIGIAHADRQTDIFIANDDTSFISEDSLQLLYNAANANPDIGLISPVFVRFDGVPYQSYGYFDPKDGIARIPEGILSFAACYIQRRLLNSIGLLDERFVGYGFEDNDLCMRAKRGQFALGVLPTVVMSHGDLRGRASSTFGKLSNFSELMKQNRRLFVEKWTAELLGLSPEDSAVVNDIIDSLYL